MMETFFLGTAIVILASVLLAVHRVVSGPAIVDRIIGANALISFIGTLALSRYFEKKGLHPEEEETSS